MGGLYVRVGLLLVAGAAVLVGAILFLTGDSLTKGLPYETYFRETVQGLDVGAPVKFRGVTLGKVTAIGLVTAEYMRDQPIQIDQRTSRLVYVRWTIDPTKIGSRVPDNGTAVEDGLRARLASQGLTGLAYVELDFVSPTLYPGETVPWEPKSTYIPSMPSTLSQFQDAGQQFLAKLNSLDVQHTLDEATGLIEDLRGQIDGGDGKQVLSGLAALLANLNRSIEGADVPGLVADLRRTSGSVRELVSGRETRALLTNAAEAADRFAQAANKLGPLLASLNQTARRADSGAADVQAELAPALRDLRAAAASLRDTTEALREYPAGTIFGAAPPRRAEAP